MKKEIQFLDLEFDSTISNLYTIVDMSTNIDVVPIFQVPNDVVAIDGFKQFLTGQKEKKAAYSKYKLRSVGVYDVSKHELISGESYDIVSEDEDIEQYLNDIVKIMQSKEDA